MAKLVLNAAKIQVPDAQIQVFSMPYDEDTLRDYRKRLRDSFFFRRDREEIQAVSIVAAPPEVNWQSRAIWTRDEPRLICALVQDAFIRLMANLGRPSKGHHPVTIPGGKNILLLISGGEILPTWLQVRTRFLVETRTLPGANGKWHPYIVLDSRSSREIEASLTTLKSIGFDLVGHYVQKIVLNEDPRLAPRRETVGRVLSFDGNDLKLEDTREGLSLLSPSEVYLEPREETFEEIVHKLAGSRAANILGALEDHLVKSRQADTSFNRLCEVLGKLSPPERPFEIAKDLAVTFAPFIAQGQPDFPSPNIAPKTQFVFDVGRGKVEQSNRAGLEKFGPYNCANFTPSSPKIAVVCDAKYKGVVETYLRKFKDGIPFQGRISPFASGFEHLFRLNGATFRIFETVDSTSTAVRKMCREIAEIAQAGSGFDVVLLQNSEEGKRLRGNDNPYLVAKSTLLQAGIASQSFLLEKTSDSDYNLAYILADLALGVYAKLGGTPWLISADHAIEHEIILGVGSTFLGEGRFGGKERIVGITSVFKGDGDYLLSNLTKAVPISDYSAALTSTLRVAIDQASQDMNWRDGDGVRIVVHAFKPMKDAEIDALEAVTNELAKFRIQFAFLHVKDTHPYSLFDKEEAGSFDRTTRLQRGKYCPAKGTVLHLSGFETLVCPWGAREVRHAEHGYPKPLLLELHRRSTFKDTTYLARQVLNFANHSWRSFGAARKPVTILYSELVADLLGKLRDVDGWSADILPTVLGKRRWFL